MPRWRQYVDEEGKSHFIPIDGAAAKQSGHAVHGDIDSFVSPIDGTVITDRKQYREHMERHGVVPAAEFTPEFYAEKAKERERIYRGERTTAEAFKNKQMIYEIYTRAERGELPPRREVYEDEW